MEIVESKEYGIANTINGVIYLHPYLKEFPRLREKIIVHEREHKKAKGFLANRKIDALTDLKFKDMWPIYKKYPKLFFKQHFPITYSKADNTLFIEWSLLFLYGFYAVLIYVIYLLISLFSTNPTMFWQIAKYLAIILGIIAVLYFIGGKLKRALNKEAKKAIEKG